ncbi:MAG TPA: hypothetical protein VEC35_11165 [Noviherbaspirillum sp.]|nr:hypothetical protein [Noviherbaspirillum sp.]
MQKALSALLNSTLFDRCFKEHEDAAYDLGRYLQNPDLFKRGLEGNEASAHRFGRYFQECEGETLSTLFEGAMEFLGKITYPAIYTNNPVDEAQKTSTSDLSIAVLGQLQQEKDGWAERVDRYVEDSVFETNDPDVRVRSAEYAIRTAVECERIVNDWDATFKFVQEQIRRG